MPGTQKGSERLGTRMWYLGYSSLISRRIFYTSVKESEMVWMYSGMFKVIFFALSWSRGTAVLDGIGLGVEKLTHWFERPVNVDDCGLILYGRFQGT